MKQLSLTALLLLAVIRLYAQLPQLYLEPKKWTAFGAMAKTAPLVVVIENEKSASDAALIAAVKEQWTNGPVKYMSGLEFSEKFKAKSLDAANLYLFNNYSRELPYTGGVIMTMNPSKVLEIPAIFKGYYLTNVPNQLINATKYKQAPPFLFFSSDALHDHSSAPIKGFYQMMIKNFNYDVNYCGDATHFEKKKLKKLKRKNGIYFLTTDSIQNKTILIVKEQTIKQEKKTKEGDVKKSNASAKKQGFATDKFLVKTTVVVFPEDIEYAVKKSDGDILIYNGGCLYSARDGSVYATTRGHKSHSLAGIISYISLTLSAVVIIVFLTMH